MKRSKLKNNQGFATSDALIAIIIIALFTGIISTLIYNIYISNSSLKRMSQANAYIVELFEYTEKLYYDEVNQENLMKYINDKYQEKDVRAVSDDSYKVESQYKIIVNVNKYNETSGNEDKLDLVKEVTITVKYKLGDKDQTITVRRIKNREALTTPNKPDLSLISLNTGEKVYPIKEKNGKYIVCDENDNTWYSYEDNKYAVAVVTSSDLKANDTISESFTKYKWIPRYAENISNPKEIKYLFSNTNKYIDDQEGYNKLIDIGTEYTVNTMFSNEMTGIWEEI